MASQGTQQVNKILENVKVFAEQTSTQVWQLFDSSEFWELHGTVLTVNWFVVAFVAILIKKKFQGGFSKFIHMILFILCNVSTLFVNFGAAYKVYPHLNTFSEWSIIKKGHTITGVVFSVLLILEWLGGINSLLGGDSSGHKKLGRVVACLGMLASIFGMLLSGNQRNAAIFAGVFLVESFILRPSAPKQQTLKSKINKSIGQLKSAKRD